MRRRTLTTLATVALLPLAGGCGNTDVANRGGDVEPGQEIEDSGVELDVEPVDIEAQAWFREGGTVEFNGRSWILAGEPVYDPAVVRVGEFRDTPLYAEVNVTAPYTKLFIPLENDYWQLLEPARGPAGTDTTQVMRQVPLDTVQ